MKSPIVISVFTVIVIGIITYEIFITRRRRLQLKKYLHQTDRLIQLLRDTVDMAYIYENSPEAFYLKFREQINISSLRKRNIIDPEMLLSSPLHRRIHKHLKHSDAELWSLLKAGFTTRELIIIYDFKNINSVYVKLYRLRGHVDKYMKRIKS